MIKAAAWRVTLIAIGAVVALGLVEVAFSLADVAPLSAFYPRSPWENGQDEVVGWSYNPGAEFTYKSRWLDESVRVKINQHGLRDREHAFEKQAGIFRILFLGDSFTTSLERPLEQVWHRLLEARLNETVSQAEVIAAGIQGWGTDQELLYYRHVGYRYRPDLVVVQFYVNDVQDNDVDLDARLGGTLRHEKPYFVLAGDKLALRNFPYKREEAHPASPGPVSWERRVRDFLRDHVRTARFVRLMIAEARYRRPSRFCWKSKVLPSLLMVYAKTYPPEYVQAWKLTLRLMGELRKEVEARGQRFAVVYFPDRWQVLPEAWQETLECWPVAKTMQWDLDRPNRLLGAYLRQEGVAFLDLTPHFRAFLRQSSGRLYLPRDWHFDRDGHALTARVLQEWLARESLVPQQRAPR